MLDVRRRTGRMTIHHRAAQSTQVTTAETIADSVRKLRDIRHSAVDERRLIERHVDQRAVGLHVSDNADHRAGFGEERAEACLIAVNDHAVADFVRFVDVGIGSGIRNETTPVRQCDDDRLGVDRAEDLVGEIPGQRRIARLAEQQHGGVGDH